MIYCPYGNIVNFSHTSRIQSRQTRRPIQTNGGANAENAINNPFPLRHVDSHLIHQWSMPEPTPLTTQNGIPIESAMLPLLTYADEQMGLTTFQ